MTPKAMAVGSATSIPAKPPQTSPALRMGGWEDGAMGGTSFCTSVLPTFLPSHHPIKIDGFRVPAELLVVLAEPEAAHAVVGAPGGDDGPELLRVVHLFQVRQLVDDEVIEDRRRRQEHAPVEVQVAVAGAAAPQGLLVFDAQVPVLELHGRAP